MSKYESMNRREFIASSVLLAGCTEEVIKKGDLKNYHKVQNLFAPGGSDTFYNSLVSYANNNSITLPRANQLYFIKYGLRYVDQNVGLSKLRALWIQGTDSKLFGWINAINPGTNNLTEVGTMTHTNDSGDISSNTSSYLLTGITDEVGGLGTITQKSAASGDCATIGRRVVNNEEALLITQTPYYAFKSLQYSTTTPNNNGAALSLKYGSYHVHHNGTDVEFYFNGSLYAHNTVAPNAFVPAEIWVSAINYGLTYNNTVRNIAITYVTSQTLTPTEVWHLTQGLNIIRMGMVAPSAGYATDILNGVPRYPLKTDTVDLILMYSQSNTGGRAPVTGSGYDKIVPNCFTLGNETVNNTGQWSNLLLNNCNRKDEGAATTGYYGIEQKMARLYKTPFYICKYSQGATPLSPNLNYAGTNFYPPPLGGFNGLLYRNALLAFTTTLNELRREFSTINVYFIPIGGENDGYDAVESSLYGGYLNDVILKFQTDLSITFAGVFVPKLSASASPVTYRANVNSSLIPYVGSSITALIDTDSFPMLADNLHYSGVGYDAMASVIYSYINH